MKVNFQLDSPVLYKYCDTRGVDILQSLRLKVTPPVEFNDPFEFMPKMDFRLSRESVAKKMSSTTAMKQIWKENSFQMDFETFRQKYLQELNRPSSPHLKRALKAIKESVEKERDGILAYMSSKFALACYSENPDSFLMWSHYTRGHQGGVVGFNVKNRFFYKGDNLMPVVYRSERTNASYGHTGLQFTEPTIALLRTKSLDWSYEREWRQIFSIRKCKKLRGETGSVQYFQELPSKAIASVILGVRCQPSTESAIRELLRTKDMRHVSLKRAILHERDFRIKIVTA